MVDLELLVSQLRRYGHTVSNYYKVPENAGEYEFVVDSNVLTLEEVRDLLTSDEEAGPPAN